MEDGARSNATTGLWSDTERNGVLSSRPELHGVSIGAFAGLVAGLSGEWQVGVALALVLFGRQAHQGHLDDARKEVGYTGGAFLLFALVGGLLRLVGHLAARQ